MVAKITYLGDILTPDLIHLEILSESDLFFWCTFECNQASYWDLC